MRSYLHTRLTVSGGDGSEARDNDGRRKGINGEREINGADGRGQAKKQKCRNAENEADETVKGLSARGKTANKPTWIGETGYFLCFL